MGHDLFHGVDERHRMYETTVIKMAFNWKISLRHNTRDPVACVVFPCANFYCVYYGSCYTNQAVTFTQRLLPTLLY